MPIDRYGFLPNLRGMSYQTILTELDEYCREAGLKASTVCVRALNDSRYVERHHRRLAALERDAGRIREYIREHPPEQKQDPSNERAA